MKYLVKSNFSAGSKKAPINGIAGCEIDLDGIELEVILTLVQAGLIEEIIKEVKVEVAPVVQKKKGKK